MFFTFALDPTFIDAQVVTTILKDQKIEEIIPWHIGLEPVRKELPPVDVEKVLEEDIRNGDKQYRYGIPVSTDYNTKDGHFYDFGDLLIWKIAFHSKDATSLNFLFSAFNLPDNAEMFIYDKTSKMVVGPITKDQINDGIWASDMVYGDEATIEVLLFRNELSDFNIHIERITHGFRHQGASREFGDALPCNNDIACTLGASWGVERDAVAKVIDESGGTCSGTLLNNACSTLTPYFYTAFHCLDANLNGALSSAEKQMLNSWVFRFGYDSPSCNGAEPTTWVSFSGANFRAGFFDTDMLLLELKGDITQYPGISLAGWDRSDNLPTNATWIHHPRGDVKKITFDAGAPFISDINESGVFIATDSGWEGTLTDGLNGDDGVLERGSSGSSIFNQDKRIIGQHSFSNPVDPDCSSSISYRDGRFFNSWTGGNTDDTRLFNWLSGGLANPPNTTNSIRVPHIQGSATLCGSSGNYSLQNPLPGTSVTWSVTPSNLFSSPPSGTGINVTLIPITNTTMGLVTLSYKMSGGGLCKTVSVRKKIWIGKPNVSLTGDSYLCPGVQGTANAAFVGGNTAQQLVSNQQWSYTGPLQYFQTFNTIANYFANSGNGVISFSVTNPCGATLAQLPYYIIACAASDDSEISIYPNPVESSFIVSGNRESDFSQDAPVSISIYDTFGQLKLSVQTNLLSAVDITSLQAGYYSAVIVVGNKTYNQKLLLIK